MLLIPFVVLTLLGMGLWVLGASNDYTGIATIGAVLVIGVGGAVTLTDLQTETGERIERDYQTINNSTVAVNETVTPTYDTVALVEEFGGSAGHLGLGGLMMIVGALLFTHTIEKLR